MNEPRMAAFLTSSGRPGFYFLVFEEGEVSGGDEIVKVDEGKERMSIAEINALLYSPQHPRDRVDRALQIQALSPGLRASFVAMFASQSDGNAGLAPASAEHPAAPGFQPLKVTAIDREATDVVSLTTQRADGEPLPETQPGQYSVLRLPGIRGARSFVVTPVSSLAHVRSYIHFSRPEDATSLERTSTAPAISRGPCSRKPD